MGVLERGVAIVVWRRADGHLDDPETLLLHRSLFAPDYAGDWAWSTPGGGREADETPYAAAVRELREETGLTLECRPAISHVAVGLAGFELFVFEAEAPANTAVALSDEHDRFEWVKEPELSRCLPSWVSAVYREVLARAPRAQLE